MGNARPQPVAASSFAAAGALARAGAATRLPALVGLPDGADPAAMLARLRGAFIGAGAVGTEAAMAFARLQPAAVTIIDKGSFKPESLNTQNINAADVGKPKALTIAHRIKSNYPSIDVRFHHGDIAELRDDALLGYDFIFLATDNIRAELDVSRRCALLGIPLIHAAVYGDMLIAQVKCLSFARHDSPCIACGLDAAEWRHADAETVWSCDPNEAARGPTVNAAPTMSVSSLCALAAHLGMVTLLRMVLRLGEPVADTMVQYCGYTHEIVTSTLKRKPMCGAEHAPWRRIALRGPIADMSISELIETARAAEGSEHDGAEWSEKGISIAVDELVFVERARCGCVDGEPVRRFARVGESLGECAGCGQARRADAFGSFRRAPLHRLGDAADRPLAESGAGDAAYIAIRTARRATLLYHRGDARAMNGHADAFATEGSAA